MSKYDFFYEILNKINIDNSRIMDSPRMTTEQEKMLEKAHNLAQINELNKKNDAITIISVILGKTENIDE